MYSVLLMSSYPGAKAPEVQQIIVSEVPEVDNPDADDALAHVLDTYPCSKNTDAIVAVVMPTEPEDGTAQFGLRAAGIFATIQGDAIG